MTETFQNWSLKTLLPTWHSNPRFKGQKISRECAGNAQEVYPALGWRHVFALMIAAMREDLYNVRSSSRNRRGPALCNLRAEFVQLEQLRGGSNAGTAVSGGSQWPSPR